ncbi:hypothetical protein AB1Y20_008963 [Prymnesium parvum]|uniref:Uncharacterized protein n=1 Tax=Prymnesium parvum TaxID=97485 RepID=A0AB34K3A4_PRYPA
MAPSALAGECDAPPLHFSEKYIEVLECAGTVLMLSRLLQRGCDNGGRYGWGAITLVRTLLASGKYSEPGELLNTCAHAAPLRTSWSGTFHCVRDGLLMAVGVGSTPRPGVVQHTVAYAAAPRDGAVYGTRVGSASQLLVSRWSESGCVEARRGRAMGLCRFDSKPSLVAWRGSMWLFVRANVDIPGGRHVQVSRRRGVSLMEPGAWSRLRMLRFSDYEVKHENNIYYFPILARDDMLVSVFPAVIDGKGAIYSSSSRDGIRWTKPLAIVESAAIGQRTLEFPVVIPWDPSRLCIQHNVSHYDTAVQFPVGQRVNACDYYPLKMWTTRLCCYDVGRPAWVWSSPNSSLPFELRPDRPAVLRQDMQLSSLHYFPNGSSTRLSLPLRREFRLSLKLEGLDANLIRPLTRPVGCES